MDPNGDETGMKWGIVIVYKLKYITERERGRERERHTHTHTHTLICIQTFTFFPSC
jgi:hypothetical protein